jgi:hypothetical protein
MCYFCSLTRQYKLVITNSLIQCQTSYLICSESLGDIIYKLWRLGNKSCLGTGGYLGIEIAGTGEMNRMGKWNELGRGVRHRGL